MTPPAVGQMLPPWVEAPAAPPEFQPATGLWLISRHADVLTALRHPAVISADARPELSRLMRGAGREYPHLLVLIQGFFFNSNPPWHDRARRFARDILRGMEHDLTPPVIRGLAAQALGTVPRDGSFDAMPLLCDRLPALVLAHGFGVPVPLIEDIARLAYDVSGAMRRRLSLRALARYEEVAAELSVLLARGMQEGPSLVASRRHGLEACGLAEEEVGAILAFFVLAGTETTGASLASALDLLGRHPAARTALRDEPTLLRRAIDEVMRYCPPVKRLPLRRADQPLELGGVAIPGGALLVLEVERAHFDAAAFPEPWRFDIRRRGPPNFAFAAGAHACLGAQLAREEASALIGLMLTRGSWVPQDPVPVWAESDVVRRLRRLPIVLHDHPA